MASSTKKRALLALIMFAWSAAVAAGFTVIWRYEAAPGRPAAEQPLHWPSAAPFAHDPARPTLIMAVHPECPCSRASLGELEQIFTHCPDRLTAVLLFEPEDIGNPDPSSSELWKRAAAIPGVLCRNDTTRAATALFHARTSGQVFLFDAQGDLVFSGGITQSRGHAGDNEGRAAIETFLTRGTLITASTPVFGCALQ